MAIGKREKARLRKMHRNTTAGTLKYKVHMKDLHTVVQAEASCEGVLHTS
jgi:hypothetical protein